MDEITVAVRKRKNGLGWVMLIGETTVIIDPEVCSPELAWKTVVEILEKEMKQENKDG
jgi:hypothetical protein